MDERGRAEPGDPARRGGAGASFAPEHFDQRGVQRLMVILIGLTEIDGELFAPPGELHRWPPDPRSAETETRGMWLTERIGCWMAAIVKKDLSFRAASFQRKPLPVFDTSRGHQLIGLFKRAVRGGTPSPITPSSMYGPGESVKNRSCARAARAIVE